MFVVTVNFSIKPESVDAFAVAIARQANNSLQLEPDCHVFDVCIATDDPGSVLLYEKYTDAAAFDVHLQSQHFKDFDALVAPWVESKTVATWIIAGSDT